MLYWHSKQLLEMKLLTKQIVFLISKFFLIKMVWGTREMVLVLTMMRTTVLINIGTRKNFMENVFVKSFKNVLYFILVWRTFILFTFLILDFKSSILIIRRFNYSKKLEEILIMLVFSLFHSDIENIKRFQMVIKIPRFKLYKNDNT